MNRQPAQAAQLDLFSQLAGPPRPRNPYQRYIDQMRAMWAQDQERERARAAMAQTAGSSA